MLASTNLTADHHFPSGDNNGTIATNKRKRRPAGTPDPDAEVVSLSPKTLLESDRYVCEICNQGFQRDQNLQMHRRRHKVPWKLLKRETPAAKKRVFVCPEPTCLHHDPCHALGDLVGIKKHFRRKHSSHRQWVCDRCSKGYAVQSDYKAHLKTCGTRGHSCDCGRVFSRVESFIEHQDACNMGRLRPELQQPPPQSAPVCLSRTASSPSRSSETNFSAGPNNWHGLVVMPAAANKSIIEPTFLLNPTTSPATTTTTTTNTAAVANINIGGAETVTKSKNGYNKLFPNLDLRLSTTATTTATTSVIPIDITTAAVTPKGGEARSTHLQLSIGSSEIGGGEKNDQLCNGGSGGFVHGRNSPKEITNNSDKPQGTTVRVYHHQEKPATTAPAEIRVAMVEKAYAEEARKQARRQMEAAEKEFANAKRIRQEAQAELDKAYALKDHAIKHINALMLQITCHACQRHFHHPKTTLVDDNNNSSLVISYMSSGVTTELGAGEVDNNIVGGNGIQDRGIQTTNSLSI